MTVSEASCMICDQITLWKNGQNPYFIHEFDHSIFVVGFHQFHPGYSLLLLKDHVRELHELDAKVQQGLFAELMVATQAIVDTFHPWKMNHSCYGNLDPHVHWHIFPRYESDPERHKHPWIHSPEFKRHAIDLPTTKELRQRIKTSLDKLL
ncbi:HIT family protein [Pantanalinema sp. GBBB05]|uniref:HIT family protein n=1 Tax=Pantanalinema sp. GBBB05 TaxID=2604139 RepID=UPI001D96C791|nr:HIT family protein [Pantanalinema sp. GBBB05]